jgi:hypothetical protein
MTSTEFHLPAEEPARPYDVERARHRFEFPEETGPVVVEDISYRQPRTYTVVTIIVIEYRDDVVEVLAFGHRLTKAGTIDLRCGVDLIENSDFADQTAERFWASTGMPGRVRIERRLTHRTSNGQTTRSLQWGTWIDGQHVGWATTRRLAMALADEQLQVRA